MTSVTFPEFSGVRCLMMPYIQGEPESVPAEYAAYADVVRDLVFRKGDVGYLTIDESIAQAGKPHRGARARTDRALHTEAGKLAGAYVWGGGGHWGGRANVELERGTEVLLASNLSDTCAVWDAEHEDTTEDGDIGHLGALYPYSSAHLMRAGEVRRIGIFTPHESLPVPRTCQRQFLRIISSGVHGREPYFTENPLMGRAP